jgi:hypothetical protein
MSAHQRLQVLNIVLPPITAPAAPVGLYTSPVISRGAVERYGRAGWERTSRSKKDDWLLAARQSTFLRRYNTRPATWMLSREFRSLPRWLRRRRSFLSSTWSPTVRASSSPKYCRTKGLMLEAHLVLFNFRYELASKWSLSLNLLRQGRFRRHLQDAQ